MSVAIDHFVWHYADVAAGTPCLEDHHRRWRYREFAERVDTAAAHLAAAGVRRGATVAIVLPNRLELLVAFMAVWRLGAVAAPLDPAGGYVLVRQQIEATGAVVVLDNRPIDSPRWVAGVPCLAVEVLGQPAPTGWVAPPDPTADDPALVCFGAGDGPDSGEYSHGWLQEVAMDTVLCLGLTESAHCQISLPLARADVIGMNFIAAIALGARLSLVPNRSQPMAKGRRTTPARRSRAPLWPSPPIC